MLGVTVKQNVFAETNQSSDVLILWFPIKTLIKLLGVCNTLRRTNYCC